MAFFCCQSFFQIESAATGCPISSHSLTICVDWDGLRDHLRDVALHDIFKLGAFAAASEFCEWVQFGIDVYIPHRKY